ncbi:hypothetical protein [Natrinema sp. DC36]|uniref:hypothetical protein n=1 Tax=Natrinema sp. DC36 TaxID=2878680 RepID=UPI001CF01931|nr:hypothetical protein [Natrinema sp. DC36]
MEIFGIVHQPSVASDPLDSRREILFLYHGGKFRSSAAICLNSIHSPAESVRCDSVFVAARVKIRLDVVFRSFVAIGGFIFADYGLREVVNAEVRLFVAVADRVIRTRRVFEPERFQDGPNEGVLDAAFRKLADVGTLECIAVFDYLVQSIVVHPFVEHLEKVDDMVANLGYTFFDFS